MLTHEAAQPGAGVAWLVRLRAGVSACVVAGGLLVSAGEGAAVTGAIPLSEYLAWLRASTTAGVRQVPTAWGGLETVDPESPGETGQGSSPETSDQSQEGREALDAALNDPTSGVNMGLGLMGTLAGPLGPVFGVAVKAMQMHNRQIVEKGIDAANAPSGPPDSGQLGHDTSGTAPAGPGQAAGGNNPGIGQDDPGVGVTGPPDVGEGPAPGPPGDPGEAGDSYRVGGVVRDRDPGLRERITAHEGEFVVKRAPAVKYRRLLESINAGQPAGVKRALRAALDA